MNQLGDKLCFHAQTIIVEKTVSEVEVDDWVWTDESDTDQMLPDGLKHQFLSIGWNNMEYTPKN